MDRTALLYFWLACAGHAFISIVDVCALWNFRRLVSREEQYACSSAYLGFGPEVGVGLCPVNERRDILSLLVCNKSSHSCPLTSMGLCRR